MSVATNAMNHTAIAQLRAPRLRKDFAMRRALQPTFALLVSSLVLSAHEAAAQAVVSVESTVPLGVRGPGVPVANAAPVRHESWAERYANGSASLIGGFGAQHAPSASQGNADAFAMVTSARFVVAHGLVLEPELSAYYQSYASNDGSVGYHGYGLRPGLRVGYARAVGDRVALVVEGGYRLDRRTLFTSASGATLDLSHEIVALVGATIFLSRHFFLEEAVMTSVAFRERDGVAFVAGVTTNLGVTF